MSQNPNTDIYEPEVEQKLFELLPSKLLTPIKLIAILVAVMGILALVFEVKTLVLHSFEVYIARLFPTILAFIVLVIVGTKSGEGKITMMMHVLMVPVILSSSFIVYKIPETFIVNIYILTLLVFTVGVAFAWGIKNQIGLVTVLVISFSIGIFLGAGFNWAMVETISIMLVIAIFSIIASYYIFINNQSAETKIVEVPIETQNNSDSEKDNLYQRMFENAIDGFYQFSPEGKILYANPAFIKILGYNNFDELENINIPSDIYKSAKDRSEQEKLLKASEIVKNYRVSLKRKDGSIFVARLNERVVFNIDKDPLFYEGSLQDFTHQAKIERERKLELDALKEEKKKASTTANNAVYTSNVKTQFLANMSHEIRTPMNSVLGFLTLIENGLFDNEEELKDFAQNARIAADSLLDIINNILDISKIEAGKMELNEIEFGLKEEIDKAFSIVSPHTKEKPLKLSYNIPDGFPPYVIGDATRYRQVVLNLLGNAIKYSESGDIKVDVEVVKQTEATIKVLTKVSDTGRGIPKDKLGLIFQPYTQLKEKKWVKSEGAGLGLMICKEFVQLMNGTIDIESEIGKGTTVSFSVVLGTDKNFLAVTEKKEKDTKSQIIEAEKLKEKKISNEIEASEEELPEVKPFVEAEEEIELELESELMKNEHQKETDEISTKEDFSEGLVERVNSGGIFDSHNPEAAGKRILLVEDNPISQKVELKLLAEAGYWVDAVSNGFDAIEALKTNNFNLVLMDIEMEDMTGLEATQKIRSLDQHIKDIPIIAVTAHSSMKDREKCLAAGMDDYIAKPINIQFLKMTIDQWLRSGR